MARSLAPLIEPLIDVPLDPFMDPPALWCALWAARICGDPMSDRSVPGCGTGRCGPAVLAVDGAGVGGASPPAANAAPVGSPMATVSAPTINARFTVFFIISTFIKAPGCPGCCKPVANSWRRCDRPHEVRVNPHPVAHQAGP